jgi:uncharacterized protein YecE (DUF72 family)
MKERGILRIGTSGIVVPGPKSSFPVDFQSRSRLHYYSTLFNTIEINSSFHKIPLPSTFLKWSEEVPDTFKFTVKCWHEITHVKKLMISLEGIDTFMNAVNTLGNKKGCLLIQFPASINFDYFNKVEEILQRVHQLNHDEEWKIAVEFRNKDWYREETYMMLIKYHASVVFHDIEGSKTPLDKFINNPIYLRFHGHNGDYKGSYSDGILQEYAVLIKGWTEKGIDVYVYFNNTMGSAFQNARLLQDLLI